MKDACTYHRPNQCLPAFSDTYLVSSTTLEEGYESVRFIRVYTALLVTVVMHAVVEPLLLHVAYQRLAGSSWHTQVFDAGLLAVSLLTAAQGLIQNEGDAKGWHQVSAFLLVGVWLLLLPMYAFRLPHLLSVWRDTLMGLWAVGVLVAAWLMCSWQLRLWTWYVWEWVLVLTQASSLTCMGLALMSTPAAYAPVSAAHEQMALPLD